MKEASLEYIINTVHNTNILPVISQCNTSCVFCSHRQNPAETEVFRLPELTLSDFGEIIGYLSPGRKIVVGESATRIIEGEPFLHHRFTDILALIRKRYKKTQIQVTTNGILLSRDDAEILSGLGGIELNVSVNCVRTATREKILGRHAAGSIEDKLRLLTGRLRFSGSCVFGPELLDREELGEIASLLYHCGADNMRVFLPGYTRLSGKEPDLREAAEDLQGFLDTLRQKYDMPILLEPAYIYDVTPRIEGVIRSSPAKEAGLLPGDIITEVEGHKVRTRVEAFDSSYRAKDPILRVSRGGRPVEVRLRKQPGSSPGFVVLYDADPGLPRQVASVAKMHGAGSVLFVTSRLAEGILREFFGTQEFSFDYEIVCADNRFFGGNICCAGLLTIGDVMAAVEEYLNVKNSAGESRGAGAHTKKPVDLILVPPVMFDHTRRDLTGRRIGEIEDRFGIAADTLP